MRRIVLVTAASWMACSSPSATPEPVSSRGGSSPAPPRAEAPPPPTEDEAAPPVESTDAPDAWPIPRPELSRVDAREDAVDVLEPGAEPRQRLVFTVPKGDVRQLALGMNMQVAMTLGSQAIDPSVLPDVGVDMTVTAGATTDGATTFAYQVVSASRAPMQEASVRLEKAVDTAVEGMRGSTGSLSIAADGRRVSADYGLPEVASAGLRPSLAGFQQSFSQLFVVFPANAVGVGARWSSTTHFEISGIPVEQRSTYTLRSRDGETLVLDVEFEQSATGDVASPAGVAFEDARFGGRGTGSLTINLDSPFPLRAEAKSRSRVSSSVTMGGRPQPVEMDLLSTLTITSTQGAPVDSGSAK